MASLRSLRNVRFPRLAASCDPGVSEAQRLEGIGRNDGLERGPYTFWVGSMLPSRHIVNMKGLQLNGRRNISITFIESSRHDRC